jgi:hypothetical protein
MVGSCRPPAQVTVVSSGGWSWSSSGMRQILLMLGKG